MLRWLLPQLVDCPVELKSGVITSDRLLWTGPVLLLGFNVNQGALTSNRVWTVHDGTNASAPVVLSVTASPGVPVQSLFPATLNNGLYIELVTGTAGQLGLSYVRL